MHTMITLNRTRACARTKLCPNIILSSSSYQGSWSSTVAADIRIVENFKSGANRSYNYPSSSAAIRTSSGSAMITALPPPPPPPPLLLMKQDRLNNCANHLCRNNRVYWRSFASSSSSSSSSSPESKEESSSSSPPHNQQSSSSEPIKIFPWRERAIEPLPRVIYKDDLSGTPKTSRSRFFKKLAVGLEMKVPFWQLFFTRSWEDSLAHNCSWAFRNALVGLISRTFQVPMSSRSIENNSKFLRFDYYASDESNSTVVKGSGHDDVHGDENQNQSKNYKETGEHSSIAADDIEEEANDEANHDADNDEYVRAMVEEKLLKLYTPHHNHDAVKKSSSAHDDPRTILKQNPITKAYLYLEPIRWSLENIFLIPSLTRDDVKQNESLRGAYTAIERVFHETGDVKLMSEMANRLIQRVSHGGTKRSIIMDVSITCLEAFYIKAGDTLVQGHETQEHEQVTHLVRFEMQTTKGETSRDRVLGSWYIIDIDDQLDGNVWH